MSELQRDKACKNCGAPHPYCQERWEHMANTNGDHIECWRPHGAILIWDELNELNRECDQDM